MLSEIATLYGGAVFAEGPRHVVRRSVAFPAGADAFVERAPVARRIDWVSRFETPAAAAALTGPAWALLLDRARLEGEMTGIVNKRLYQGDVIDEQPATTSPPA